MVIGHVLAEPPPKTTKTRFGQSFKLRGRKEREGGRQTLLTWIGQFSASLPFLSGGPALLSRISGAPRAFRFLDPASKQRKWQMRELFSGDKGPTSL